MLARSAQGTVSSSPADFTKMFVFWYICLFLGKFSDAKGEINFDTNKSNKVLKSFYSSSESGSNLKVVSIHSNPREVLERFLSDSSNHENGDDSNNSSLQEEETPNSLEDFNICNNSGSFSSSNDYLQSYSNDDNSNQSVFAADGNKSNGNYDEDIVMKEIPDEHLRENDSSPDYRQENDRKAYESSTAGLLHGMDNILDECSNQSITNGNISFSSEAVYSTGDGEENLSPSGRSVQSTQSIRSDSSTPENVQKSSPESSLCIQNSIVDKHIPFLQDGLGIQSNFTFSSASSEQCTVDASMLGFSSFASVPSRISPELENQPQVKQITPPPAQGATLATTPPKNVADEAHKVTMEDWWSELLQKYPHIDDIGLVAGVTASQIAAMTYYALREK